MRSFGILLLFIAVSCATFGTHGINTNLWSEKAFGGPQNLALWGQIQQWKDVSKVQLSTEGRRGLEPSLLIDSTSVANDAAYWQPIRVFPHTDYILTGWIRTKDVVTHPESSVDIGASLCIYGTYSHSTSLAGTTGWTLVSLRFRTGEVELVRPACRLGYWNCTASGQAWFSGISLKEDTQKGGVGQTSLEQNRSP